MLDYKKERFEAVYAKQPFDVIVDSIGGKSMAIVSESCQVMATTC